jgi:hypothetical protein
MEGTDWSDRAFYDDGDWIHWSEINEQLRYKEWIAKYPNALQSIIPYFEGLVSLAERYYSETGLHLNVYGDIGELFGAITYGIKLNRTHAQGSDGRMGNDHVEIKTIAPFSKSNEVWVKPCGNWSKLLVVKISDDFQVSGRMADRRSFRRTRAKYLLVKWQDLSSEQ